MGKELPQDEAAHSLAGHGVFGPNCPSGDARRGRSRTLLGRVIGHEVGHLPLGTGYHGQAGVMRADWPDALLNIEREEWHFSMIESRECTACSRR
jgi:hypothetical protein